LSYSLRRVDAHTLRCAIGGGIAAKIVLRPPAGAPLRSVTVDGSVHSEFDEDSVTVLSSPAEIICSIGR
jgi:hypothetical protein